MCRTLFCWKLAVKTTQTIHISSLERVLGAPFFKTPKWFICVGKVKDRYATLDQLMKQFCQPSVHFVLIFSNKMIHFKVIFPRNNTANNPAYMGSRTLIHATHNSVRLYSLYYILGYLSTTKKKWDRMQSFSWGFLLYSTLRSVWPKKLIVAILRT